MPLPPADPIALLTGRWSVTRRLRDRAGREGAFAGEAWFAPAAGGLRWVERGRLRYRGHDGPASRRLVIVGGREGWMVTFEDGRPFHPLDLSAGACEVVHHCGDDVYRGAYRLDGPDTLAVRWRVTGPRKDDEIVTTYRRLER